MMTNFSPFNTLSIGTRDIMTVTITNSVKNPNDKKLSQKNTVTMYSNRITSFIRGSARCTGDDTG